MERSRGTIRAKRERVFPVRLLIIAVCFALSGASAMAADDQTSVPVTGVSTTIGLTLPGARPRTIELDAPTLFHTLTSDFFLQDDGTIFVQTGDIPAMWLRDSSAQALPYTRFISAYPQLEPVMRGVIARDTKNILISAYANAFTAAYKIWEEKWEVDSLAYPALLIWTYWQYTGDRSIFTTRLRWAFLHIVSTYECEQRHRTCSRYRSRFLQNDGSGASYADTGMIWGAFRPSDDPVRYPFNIPQQMFAARSLDYLASLSEIGYNDDGLAFRARELAAAIRMGVDQFAQVYDFRFGWLYAYEVDGAGNAQLMDDANLPNLLAAPYLRTVASRDALYIASRRFSLSNANPYYYRGRYAAGLGSPHTPTGWIWPLGIISAAITSRTSGEVGEALAQLRAVDGSKGLFYESVDPDRPWHFTRGEFGWANALYAELIFRSVARLPANATQPGGLPDVLGRDSRTPAITSDIESWRAAATIYTALTRILSD
ncbi:MAG: metal-independent alpha-mannosidase [Candidatus Eremiobacter antarcticus]|nr:glycoside hydrolase family 125 protein [Candidatus Eremiobacteraeota bacterium]PZR61349.1 MAG: metal-independent alpha-mannosidase [Candidatus Eremiobacter sp. RRmetagenome_bin22]